MSYSNRRVRNWLLLPKVQLRYAYYFIALVVVPQVIFLIFLVNKLQEIGVELYSRRATVELVLYIESAMNNLALLYSVCLFFVLFLILYGTIVISHRFIGPMYVMKNYLIALRDGQPMQDRQLRKDDELKEIFDLLKEIGKHYKKPEAGK